MRTWRWWTKRTRSCGMSDSAVTARSLTTRSYAGGIALFLRWCARTGRHWHDGVEALGLFITWLRHAGPQASGVDVVVGGQVLAGPGAVPVRAPRGSTVC